MTFSADWMSPIWTNQKKSRNIAKGGFAVMMHPYDDDFVPYVLGDLHLRRVNQAGVMRALQGYDQALLPDKDWEWLAMAVRRSFGMTLRTTSEGPQRTSNATIRGELLRMASLAGTTWTELFDCDVAVEGRLWDHAEGYWDGSGGIDNGDGVLMGPPTDFLRFKAAIAELNWMSGFMRDAASTTRGQRGPWRKSEEKELRVERAQYVAPIYEAAFGKLVSANNYPNDARHHAPTPFMDFYDRVVTLAFGARETTNLAEVVKEACRRHRDEPIKFSKRIIPGL